MLSWSEPKQLLIKFQALFVCWCILWGSVKCDQMLFLLTVSTFLIPTRKSLANEFTSESFEFEFLLLLFCHNKVITINGI